MVFYFLFKKNTAIDVRMSDWSSDVCSSDLVLEPDELGREPEGVLDQQRLVERLRSRPQEEDGGDGELRQDQQVGQGRGPEDDALFHESYRPVWKLVRASCGTGVWQVVCMSGVCVTLNIQKE